MDLPDIERIQKTTRDFNNLQGLKTMVSGGLANCGMAILLLGIDYVPNLAVRFLVICVAGMGLLLGSLFLYFAMDAYYRRTFGDVYERRQWSPRQWIWFGAVAWVLCFLLFVVLDHVRAISVFWGSGLIYMWLARGHRLALLDQLLLGSLVLGLATPPVYAALGLSRPSGFAIACILAGLAGIVAGFLDHLRLGRVMRPPGAPPSAAEAGAPISFSCSASPDSPRATSPLTWRSSRRPAWWRSRSASWARRLRPWPA